MIDRSITAITLGGFVSLWLWLMTLSFTEDTHTRYETGSLTHSRDRACWQTEKKQKVFPWHYWFYQKEAKAGLWPCCRPNEHAQPCWRRSGGEKCFAASLQPISVSVCLSVGLSQQGVAKLMSGLQGQCSPNHIAPLRRKYLSTAQFSFHQCLKMLRKFSEMGHYSGQALQPVTPKRSS